MRPMPLWMFGLLAILLTACVGAVATDSEQPDSTPGPGRTEVETSIAAATPTMAGAEETILSTPIPEIKAIEQIDLVAVPEIDTTQHSVPLEEIIFDTFQPVNRAVPLTEAQPALIRSLRDAIPPLYEPRFISVAETDKWLSESDIVLGHADGNEAYAYPIKTLNFHEMVRHRVDSRDILAS